MLPRFASTTVCALLLASSLCPVLASSAASASANPSSKTTTPASLPAQLGTLRITDGYARSTVPKQANGAAWLSISNSGKQGDKLLRVSSPLAERVELHTSSMDGGMMRMREIDDLALPAGSSVNMQPGNGAHLMLIGLKQALQAGQKLPLLLEFDKAGKLTLEIAIKPLAP